MHYHNHKAALAGLCVVLLGARPATADKPPDVRIVEPAARTAVFADQVIQFRGEAMDLEDPQLAPTKLVWTSDVSGVLGTGFSCPKMLPAGVHLISFQATDSKGNVGKTSLVLRVIARPKAPASAKPGGQKAESQPAANARAATQPERHPPATQPSPRERTVPAAEKRPPASRPAAKLPQTLPADSPLKDWKPPRPSQLEAAMIERIEERIAKLSEQDKAAFLQELLGLASSLNYTAVAEFTLSHGADVNAPDEEGYPPIQLAHQVKTISLLLMHGADCNAISRKEGYTALHMAMARSSGMALAYLLTANPDLNAIDLSGQTPLHKVVLNKDYYAESVLKEFLQRRPNLDVQDKDGMSALHLISQAGKLPLVRMLLAAKADTSLTAKGGQTALHLAVQNGHVAVADELIKSGCDTGAQNNEGQTALHLAVVKKLPDIVVLLIEKKAPLEVPDKLGRTPLTLADQLKEDGQIAARLRLAGAKK